MIVELGMYIETSQCQIRRCWIRHWGCSASCPVSDSALRHRWAHEAQLWHFDKHLKVVLDGSEALYACSHSQCQIRQRQIWSTADSAPLNLTLRHHWAHGASLLSFNTNSKLVLNGSEALYACSHAQCQIRWRWIWHWGIAGHMRHHYYLSIPILSWY